MTTRLTENDFFTALLCGLRLRGINSLGYSGLAFQRLVVAAYEKLKELSDEHGFELQFVIMPHWLHGDSETIARCVNFALSIGLLSIDAPRYDVIRWRMDGGDANDWLARLQIPQTVTEQLTEAFLTALYAPKRASTAD